MSRGAALSLISEVCAEQWGMITAGQARRLGVSRVDLNRLVSDGSVMPAIEASRVYRLAGAPSDPDLDALRAAWLQLGGSLFWEERWSGDPTGGTGRSGGGGQPDAVVSHRSAAHACGLGDLIPDRHEFYVLRRHRPRRDDLRLRVDSKPDWASWRGLPVTTVARTIADLLDAGEDESGVAGVVRDARHDGLLTDGALREAVGQRHRVYGRRTPDELFAALTGER